jgi:hypothetical protein
MFPGASSLALARCHRAFLVRIAGVGQEAYWDPRTPGIFNLRVDAFVCIVFAMGPSPRQQMRCYLNW